MKRLKQSTGVGIWALLSAGAVACADGVDNTLIGDDIVLTGNAGNGGAGGATGGSGGTSVDVGGATGFIPAGGSGGTDTGGTGGTDTGGTGGTEGGGCDSGSDPGNLVTNPDFESGVDDWSAAFGGTLSASTAQAHTCSQSARVTDRTGTYQGAHYDLTDIVDMGATYSVSAFARISGAASDAVRVTARIRCDGQADAYVTVASATGSDSEWTELSGSLAIPSAFECFMNDILLYVEGPAAGVDLYVDDVEMLLTDAPVELENLISNPDFEAGLSDWSAAFGGTLEASSDAHGGAQSARVTDRTGTYQGAHYDLTDLVDMGATYSFSAFAKIGGAASDTVNLTARLRCWNAGDQYLPIDSMTGSDTAWGLLAGDLVLPSAYACSLRDLLVYVEGPAAGVDVYVDDVWAVETAPADIVDNLFTNSDFETGVSGWTAAFGGTLSASTAQALNGTQSALVTGRSGTYQGAHANLTDAVEQGATYSFRGFARISGAASDTVNLTARLKCDGLADQYVNIDSVTDVDGAWTALSGDFQVPAAHECFMTELLVYAEGPAAGVDLFIDDMWAVESAPAPAVENLFTNSDFEAGTAGWTAAFGGTLSASTAQAHSGAQSAVVTGRSGTYQGAFVNLTNAVDLGATYAISAFARIGGATSDTINLTARLKCDGKADEYMQLDTATGSDSAWSLLSGDLVLPPPNECFMTELLVYVEGPAADVDVYVDDAWAVETAAAPVVTNLFTNSDFEADTSGWYASGGTLSASTAQAHSGAQSALVTGRTSAWQGPSVNLTSTLTQGTTYSFSAFARIGNEASHTLKLSASVQCESLANQFFTIDEATGSDSAWTLLEGNFTVPAEGDCTLEYMSVYVEGPAAGVDIYVDDVWAVEAP